jgi:hypothetical protein
MAVVHRWRAFAASAAFNRPAGIASSAPIARRRAVSITDRISASRFAPQLGAKAVCHLAENDAGRPLHRGGNRPRTGSPRGRTSLARSAPSIAVARHVLVTVLSLHPTEVMVPCRSAFGTPCCLHPTVAGSALGATHFRGHIHVHRRYGPVTRDLPELGAESIHSTARFHFLGP